MKRFTRLTQKFLAVVLALTVGLPALLPAPALAMPATPSPAAPWAAPYGCTYVVQPGDNLYRISLRYGISYYELASANGLSPYSVIYPGMVLRVPCAYPSPSPVVCSVHVVQPGEWLALIARNYGVSWQSIVQVNHLSNPNTIYVGQRLLITCSTTVPLRTITIATPVSGQLVCSPIVVSGQVSSSPFESTLRGRVYNEWGTVVGQDSFHVNAPMGQPGSFSGSLAFNPTQVRNGSLGRVEIAETSARDGSVVASRNVAVRFSCGY